ncbi:MSMEG_0569 family flavin-dependent oxidoreductase [Kineosporia sp. J2-2]|uniref:MSMEG_0569 family flavin-dependent oxidoreductase n=1 Tax=Kineosporia corallincola TaxID=2835133 RepID=A0ABS5TBU4_9ACTN|nr:MSMEG_0569 family flavin-dependent oxidoreductase [Kineosporia corallincola]MBT0767593.1 MSMEG_0569 family flavin-dependent oxidoreductase [Kineosporia corallincola]
MKAKDDLSGHLLAGGLDGRHVAVAVIGGGQAGLAASHCLSAAGVDHVVLERHRVGYEWSERRWDSFSLVTPNRQCRLPGHEYAAGDPDGFMVREQIVDYIRDYARSFDPPLHEGVDVVRLSHDGHRFQLSTTRGTLHASQVVIATGAYHLPRIPGIAERLPRSVFQLHSADYKNPQQLPDGATLVVGTGQSGCQIAEDLHLAGRTVHLATGNAPRVARFYRGRDCMTWLDEIGHYTRGITEFADQEATRHKVNHYVTGRDGGRDIDLRAFARDGMHLYGRLRDITPETISFDDDLRAHLDGADAVAESIKDLIDAHIERHHLDQPTEPRYTPVWEPPENAPGKLDLAGSGITSVIWCTGFDADYRWVDLPVFDGRGYPTHHRGVTSLPGLYVLGLPWQWTWGSGRFRGVGDDARHLTEQILRAARGARQIA